jgi:ureidoglycolate hydrolase
MRICEDCDRAVPTKWIISLRHQQMLVVVAKYHDLEQATPRAFLSSSNSMGY